MKQYEDKILQKKALDNIPMNLLEKRAQERLRAIQKDVKKGLIEDVNISVQEMLILELLKWFKESFFKWVDNPKCRFCSSKTTYSHLSTDPVHLVTADSVEMHHCKACVQYTPFFRYKKLETLLETREGRCGEWAKVFTLFCRSIGWETRFIVDETDHVWTEVYSFAQQRWLHCDPCENVCDYPLIYESGWDKKLSYVIAYSHDDIQDVTWRYSSNHSQLLQNRTKCSEEELIDAIFKIRDYIQSGLSKCRKQYLIKRMLFELVDLMVEKKPTENEKQGRVSGSLLWRLERGETHDTGNGYVWTPKDIDVVENQICVRYSPSLDRYERLSASGDAYEIIKRWKSGINSFKNMFRKEEKDWEMVYLCRTESSDEGEVHWKFDVATSNKVINEIYIQFLYTTYENGEVDAKLYDDDKILKLTSEYEQHTDMFKGRTSFTVSARLNGGKGKEAWQHAQLFRQNMNGSFYSFCIKITLE